MWIVDIQLCRQLWISSIFVIFVGFCEPGYYCPFNSTSPTQVACPPGRYGSTRGLLNADCTALCPVGHYCPAGSNVPTICRAGE